MRLLALAAAAAAGGTAHAAVNCLLLRSPSTNPTASPLKVAVLVPVRDEAAHVRPCLSRLQEQKLVPRLRIVVLDDCSTDETADLVRAVAAGDDRILLVTGVEPPAGWLGKPHACAQLAAACPDADVLVFVDADVRLEPLAVAGAVEQLAALDVDLLCPFPRQQADTWAERLVQPLLLWSWLTFVPLRAAERSARASLAVATGQFLVVRREAYVRAGGHAAVRTEVMEDLALTRNVRRAGGRTAVVDGARLAHCRMYPGWKELREGYSKSLWTAFGSPAGAAVVVGAATTVYVVPPLAALAGSRLGMAGYLFAVTGRCVIARRTGSRPFPDSLLHPASVAVVGYLTGRSLWQHRRGRLEWKGRRLPAGVGQRVRERRRRHPADGDRAARRWPAARSSGTA